MALSEDEKSALIAAAGGEGLRLAAYVRKVALMSLPLRDSQGLPVIESELGHILSLLGRIATSLRDREPSSSSEALFSALKDIRRLRDVVMDALGVKP